MLKHGEIFTHNKQQAVLLLDKVILSLDDKEEDEFVFATIHDGNIDQDLYFVVSKDSYIKFNKEYPKATLFGFWHSLFINNKIDLSAQDHCLAADGLIYRLSFRNGELLTAFSISEEDIDSNIDIELSKFEVLISPADKVKKRRLQHKIKLAAIALLVSLVAFGFFALKKQNTEQSLVFTQKVADIKAKIALQEAQIIKVKKIIYKSNKTIQQNIRSLLFLKFKDIVLLGDIDSLNGMVKVRSNNDMLLLQNLVQEYPQYKLKRHAEALPTLEFGHE